MLDRASLPGDFHADQPLRILHVLRAPLGGLFRHVVDLTRGQIARGHSVGIVCDSTTGGETAAQILAQLKPNLKLGVTRVPMQRVPHLGDLAALRHVLARTRNTTPDIVHGHGSKGGLYARLPGLWSRNVVRAYTPHGGSFNYKPGTFGHKVFMAVERMLKAGTDIFLFESAYIAERFRAFAGDPGALTRVVWNGIAAAEFVPVITNPDAVDFLYIGELRAAKGIDTFIDALGEIDANTDLMPRVVMAGTGPDRDHLIEQVVARGLSRQIQFVGALPARTAFQMARTMVVPSRAESLPYVVLEAAGGQVPMVSTNVGGIPEVFGPYADQLIACNNSRIMARALVDAMGKSPDARRRQARDLSAFVASRFTIDQMVNAVISGYREALMKKHVKIRPKAEALITN